MNDSSMHSYRSTSGHVPQPNDSSGNASVHKAPATGGASEQHRTFLDGSFAGGWQSNARCQVIFRILEVIRQMRPDTNRVSSKLPHMAKSLEEYLYRSAQTKEEYMDFSTLRRRLQDIAHGLEVHQSTSSNSMKRGGDQSIQNDADSSLDKRRSSVPSSHVNAGGHNRTPAGRSMEGIRRRLA